MLHGGLRTVNASLSEHTAERSIFYLGSPPSPAKGGDSAGTENSAPVP